MHVIPSLTLHDPAPLLHYVSILVSSAKHLQGCHIASPNSDSSKCCPTHQADPKTDTQHRPTRTTVLFAQCYIDLGNLTLDCCFALGRNCLLEAKRYSDSAVRHRECCKGDHEWICSQDLPGEYRFILTHSRLPVYGKRHYLSKWHDDW